MPCYRCGARQTDPDRGPSPWKRGVRHREHVLVCPDCQRGRDWSAELDACPFCTSTALQRSLGETTCRSCGRHVDEPVAPRAGSSTDAAAGGLADDVAAALERVLGRAPR